MSATVSAGLAPGYTIGNGIEAMDQIADKVLDETFSTALSGEARDYTESSSNTFFAFIMALILIYLLLAAQFESFVDPLDRKSCVQGKGVSVSVELGGRRTINKKKKK